MSEPTDKEFETIRSQLKPSEADIKLAERNLKRVSAPRDEHTVKTYLAMQACNIKRPRLGQIEKYTKKGRVESGTLQRPVWVVPKQIAPDLATRLPAKVFIQPAEVKNWPEDVDIDTMFLADSCISWMLGTPLISF